MNSGKSFPERYFLNRPIVPQMHSGTRTYPYRTTKKEAMQYSYTNKVKILSLNSISTKTYRLNYQSSRTWTGTFYNSFVTVIQARESTEGWVSEILHFSRATHPQERF